jgi:TfoX/Sxy family transcriptional regulator of competence genes
MASSQAVGDYLLEQAGDEITLRKMFGEYAVKIGEKTVGLLCDDQLYLRILPETTALLGAEFATGQPYPGAKPWYRLDPDLWEDRDLLRQLLHSVEAALPAPKPKKPKATKKAAHPRKGLPPDMPPELM